MHATLVYPPFMDPRAPQLALPSLAAFLRVNGVTVAMHDLALDGLLWMTGDESLERCRRRLLELEASDSSVVALLRPFDRATELVPWALQTLRDPGHFFDPRDFLSAREVLSCVVRAHCAASGERVRASLDPIEYSVVGRDRTRLAELVRATAGPDEDLFFELYEQNVLPSLASEAPDLIGITLTNQQQWLPGLSLARKLKAQGHFVVLGGALISKFTASLRAEFFDVFADGVIAYEGETALLELLHQLSAGRAFERVPNLIYFDGSRVRSNPTHVEDVNELPTPDFDGLPLDRYLTPEPVLPILTGKGCYFNRCKFCDIPYINHVATKPYRVRAPELVVQDVRALAQKHGARHFAITDEALSPKLLLKLAQAFEPYRHEDRNFTGYARLEDGFTRAVFDEIAAMGVRKLFFGLESASQKMIDHMDKGTCVASAPRILRDCRDAGIRFHVFSIIGLPEETEAMARETYQFFIDNREILDTPGNSFGINRFSLDLRTAYYQDRAKLGLRVIDESQTGEFVVGLAPDRWQNTRGLSFDEADTLLKQELGPGLVNAFRRLYGTVYAVWPISEEYSVLYCRHYLGQGYPFAAALPDHDSDFQVTLRLNPAADRQIDGFELRLATHRQAVTMPRAMIDIATEPRPRSVRQLLSDLNEPDQEAVFTLLDRLVSSGLLQLRTAVVGD